MEELTLTKAQLERMLKDAPVVVLNSNTDAGLVYYERTKYRGRPSEGKWITRAGREHTPGDAI